jgi:hypothetical protein
VLSSENRVIVAGIALSVLTLFVVGRTVGDVPTWVGAAIILGVGVVLPTLVNEYRRWSAESDDASADGGW